jgi:hypothetical protein
VLCFFNTSQALVDAYVLPPLAQDAARAACDAL